jgi:hypothetical protein
MKPLTDAEFPTFYTIWCRWPGEIRLFTVEAPEIHTDAEAMAELKQHENAVRVFRHDYDVPRRDVSEDLAEQWLSDLFLAGFDPQTDDMPAFIAEHISRNRAIAEWEVSVIPAPRPRQRERIAGR